MALPFPLRRLTAAALLAGLLCGLGATAASAQGDEQHEASPAVVDVVEASGFLDPVLVGMMADTLRSVDPNRTVAIVFQVNSTASVVPVDELVVLADLIVEAPVPVSFWVGPSKARATGPMAQLVALGDDVGIAPGARMGATGESFLPAGSYDPAFGPTTGYLRDRTVGYQEAIDLGLARPAPVLLEHLVGVPGFEVRTVVEEDGSSVQPVTPTRFRQLDVVDQFFHTVASPAVTYLLLLVGLGLLVFELYTAGVGIAGVIGAVSFLLATYGLGVLPARGWAVGLMVLAFLGYAIDVQAGVPEPGR